MLIEGKVAKKYIDIVIPTLYKSNRVRDVVKKVDEFNKIKVAEHPSPRSEEGEPSHPETMPIQLPKDDSLTY